MITGYIIVEGNEPFYNKIKCMNRIDFIGVTPEDLKNELSKSIDAKLKSFLEYYKPKAPNDYLTRKQVAEMFDVDLSTIHNWCKKGKLNPLGIGARVYFLRADVEKSLIPLNPNNNEK